MTTVRTTAEKTEQLAAVTDFNAPLVLDLGARSKKQIKRLRRGDGKLMERIGMAIEELKKSGDVSAAAQPIVIVVRERREKGLAALLK